jgi:hypothetical protein
MHRSEEKIIKMLYFRASVKVVGRKKWWFGRGEHGDAITD